MALTEEQLEHYFREGYVLAPGLVPRAAVEAVLRHAPTEVNDRGRWQPLVFEHAAPLKHGPAHRLLVEPSVVEVVEQVFAALARVWYGMLAIVPARGGHGLPWHQDNQYTQLIGSALNVFIALSEVTPEKAGLWVAPRSHRLGTQPARRNETTAPGHREAEEPGNGIPLPAMQPGDACIFDRQTLHRSLQNHTDAHRYAYAAQYLAENTRLAETGKKDPLRMLAADLRDQWQAAGFLE